MGSGDDTVYGTGDNNMIDGGDGDDTIFGGGGMDNIMGGAGDDIIQGNAGLDVMDGQVKVMRPLATPCCFPPIPQISNFDMETGVVSNGETATNFENAVMGSGANTVIGNDDDNMIDGGDGIDTLYGGMGADNLRGPGAGGDNDVLSLGGDAASDSTGQHLVETTRKM